MTANLERPSPAAAEDPRDEGACCANCPAFRRVLGANVVRGPLARCLPEVMTGTCRVAPKIALHSGRKKPARPVVWAWPEMQGSDVCYSHPALIEAMEPELWFEPVGPDEGSEE